MIKFIVGIAIVIFCSCCGYKLAGKYRRKKEFYRQLSTFNERFLDELSYHRRPIIEFINAHSYKGEFQVLIYTFLDYLMDKEKEAFLTDGQYPFLKAEEKGEIKEYFLMLGRGSVDTQKNYFSSAKTRLENMRTEAENTCNRYVDLYVKIGFLCGLFILILII
jgi:stage III sporulation protein AB